MDVPPEEGDPRSSGWSVGEDLKQKDPSNNDGKLYNLPFELLRNIFLLLLVRSPPGGPSSQPSFHNYILGPSRSKEPMSLTYVCSWWRAVALAVPELWAAVSGTQDWTQSTTFGVLRVWMNNACMSSTTSGAGTVFPLDLHLAAPLPTSPDLREARRMVRVFRLFLNHVGMCRSLNLRLDKNLLRELEILLQTPSSPDVIHRHPALLLEDVEFAFPAKMSVCVDHINALIAWLNAAPALRRLRWTYFFDNERLHMEALPWHKLEEVILQCPMSFDRSLACLSQCTSAKTVFISNLGRYSPFFDHIVSTTTLHHLTSLSLYDGETAPLLLNYLTLPALKSLAIKSHPYTRMTNGIFFLTNFLSRSKCTLKKLVLFQHSMSPAEVQDFFALPGLAEIDVVDLCYERARTRFLEFLEKGGGKKFLAGLGVTKLMVWVSRPSDYLEEHVGWKELGKTEHLKDYYKDYYEDGHLQWVGERSL